MSRLRRPLAVLIALAAACETAPRRTASAPADSAPRPPAAPVLPDSLALRAPDGTELWFTDARHATAADGRACVERVMQLRRDTLRLPVPLLYTGERPRLVNDTLAEAHIYLHCVPGNLYRINLRTGQPIYVGLPPK